MVAVATPEFVDVTAGVPADANAGMAPDALPGMAGALDDAALPDQYDAAEVATEAEAAPVVDPETIRQQVMAEMAAQYEQQFSTLRSTKDREASHHRITAELAINDLTLLEKFMDDAAQAAIEQGTGAIVIDPAQWYRHKNERDRARQQQFVQRSQQNVSAAGLVQHAATYVANETQGRLTNTLGLDEGSIRQLTTRQDYQVALTRAQQSAAAFLANPNSVQAGFAARDARDHLFQLTDQHAQTLKAEAVKRGEAAKRSAQNIQRAQARGPQSTVTHGGGAGGALNAQSAVAQAKALASDPSDYTEVSAIAGRLLREQAYQAQRRG